MDRDIDSLHDTKIQMSSKIVEIDKLLANLGKEHEKKPARDTLTKLLQGAKENLRRQLEYMDKYVPEYIPEAEAMDWAKMELDLADQSINLMRLI